MHRCGYLIRVGGAPSLRWGKTQLAFPERTQELVTAVASLEHHQLELVVWDKAGFVWNLEHHILTLCLSPWSRSWLINTCQASRGLPDPLAGKTGNQDNTDCFWCQEHRHLAPVIFLSLCPQRYSYSYLNGLFLATQSNVHYLHIIVRLIFLIVDCI